MGSGSAKKPTESAPERPGGGLTYAEAGVSIDAGDRFVGMIQSAMRRTHGPRVISNPGGFAGLFRLDYNERLFKRNYRDPVLVACADGVGTKVKIAVEMGDFDTIGIDLVAMNVNDLIVQGAEPLFFLDYIATGRLEPERLARLVQGVAEGCRQAGCALLGGETAEMPDVYPEGEIDLAGFSVGVVELSRAVDPLRVEAGDIVLGLASDGVHSNGYSLVRRIVERAGIELEKPVKAVDAARPFGSVLLTPTRIYAEPIVRLLRGYKVKRVVSGMAHITGGGVSGNLVRSIPDDVDAVLNLNAWETPAVFSFLQDAGRVDDEEMEHVFNMGVGYCLIVRPAFADAVAEKLRRAGERVFRMGRIEKGKGRVRYR